MNDPLSNGSNSSPIPRAYDPESILDYVKKNLGLAHDYEHFDVDVLTSINSTLLTLNQIGLGPKEVFFITDHTSKWNQIFEAREDLEAAKYYIYLKVRTLFDPPANSYVLDAMERQIAELEWRLRTQVDRMEENME